MFPNQHFVLGFDTFVRLLDVRYYDGSQARLHDILRQLDEVKTSFYVGGRLNNLTQRFEVLDEGALDIVPLDFRHMFTGIKDFRVDLSSTELRAKGHIVV